MEERQGTKPTEKQLHALYDYLLILEMHWDTHVPASGFGQFYQSSIVTEPSTADQFTAGTQEVFGEWSF